jgi:hypothetical protein
MIALESRYGFRVAFAPGGDDIIAAATLAADREDGTGEVAISILPDHKGKEIGWTMSRGRPADGASAGSSRSRAGTIAPPSHWNGKWASAPALWRATRRWCCWNGCFREWPDQIESDHSLKVFCFRILRAVSCAS